MALEAAVDQVFEEFRRARPLERRQTLGNLDAHLRGGQGIVLPDYSDPSPEVQLSIVIDAPLLFPGVWALLD